MTIIYIIMALLVVNEVGTNISIMLVNDLYNKSCIINKHRI